MEKPSASRRSVLGLLGAAPVAIAAGPARASTGAGERGGVPRDLRPGGEYDRFVAERAAADEFSGTVLLAHRGKTVLQRAHGMADKDKKLPNRTDTLFLIGSITKCFTATAVLQLLQRRKVALHEPLGTYLDGFPAEAAAATVHQLLTHTSGVGRSPIRNGPPGEEELSWDTVEEVWEGNLAIIRALPPQFTPGTQYRYSNDGYIVLGAIVAAVSGMTYYDYVREHVFKPAGMTRTAFYTRPEVLAADDMAHSYTIHRQTGERYDFTKSREFQFVGTPAGSAFSTAGELLKFVTALREDGKLLRRAFAELGTGAKTVVPPEEGQDPLLMCSHYGYGFASHIFDFQRLFGHTGGGFGISTSWNRYPDLDWVSVILGNYDRQSTKPVLALERRLITAR
ncbi:serine hydrolase domain-containing protein [Nonomuraea sp. NPDC050404]|uniref:serine hydrolase domain-containing protein n=1 Tax=Nonomuraea sp. NPDC050404 TaxID=3155783 RepID=UPI0033EBD35F